MKNSIYLDVDTEREQQIIIGKGPDTTPPETPEAAALMITNDIACLCEALCNLIHVADQSGYSKKEDLVRVSIDQLNTLLVEAPTNTTEESSSDESQTTPSQQ